MHFAHTTDDIWHIVAHVLSSVTPLWCRYSLDMLGSSYGIDCNGLRADTATTFIRQDVSRPYDIRGVSKKFGEWSDISKATWASSAPMHMAIERYIEKRHLA
jgi:hypothetical protein